MLSATILITVAHFRVIASRGRQTIPILGWRVSRDRIIVRLVSPAIASQPISWTRLAEESVNDPLWLPRIRLARCDLPDLFSPTSLDAQADCAFSTLES